MVREIDNVSYTVIVSAFDRNGQRLLYRLRLTLVSSLLVSVMVIIAAGWYFSKQTLKPVERIIETAEKISGSDLHLRVPIPRGKNELVRLVNTINDSLDRLQKSFEVQKTFVANASHELRTPLTALHGDLEIALLKERSADEYKGYLKIA
ncbi:MAG: HAMP domain-containing protein, partial [Chroococcales cyanobacterium metabat2.561]